VNMKMLATTSKYSNAALNVPEHILTPLFLVHTSAWFPC
jgi:hypothetical protein